MGDVLNVVEHTAAWEARCTTGVRPRRNAMECGGMR